MKQIEIHYNPLQTISEQLEDYEVEDVKFLDKLNYSIFLLYIHDILTESQKDKAIQRLHKKVLKSIKGVKNK